MKRSAAGGPAGPCGCGSRWPRWRAPSPSPARVDRCGAAPPVTAAIRPRSSTAPTTTLAKWPYIVGILQKDEPSTFYAQFCGGSRRRADARAVGRALHVRRRGNPLDRERRRRPRQRRRPLDEHHVARGQRASPSPRSSATRSTTPTRSGTTTRCSRLASPAPVTPVTIVPPSSDYRWAGGRDRPRRGLRLRAVRRRPRELHADGLPAAPARDAAADAVRLGLQRHRRRLRPRTSDPTTMVCAGSLGKVRRDRPRRPGRHREEPVLRRQRRPARGRRAGRRRLPGGRGVVGAVGVRDRPGRVQPARHDAAAAVAARQRRARCCAAPSRPGRRSRRRCLPSRGRRLRR